VGWVCGTLEEMLSEAFPCLAAAEGPHQPPCFSQNLPAAW